MPFVSRAQMRACYARRSRKSRSSSKWNCDKWLKKTIKNGKICLPEYKGGKVRCTKVKSRSRRRKYRSKRRKSSRR